MGSEVLRHSKHFFVTRCFGSFLSTSFVTCFDNVAVVAFRHGRRIDVRTQFHVEDRIH